MGNPTHQYIAFDSFVFLNMTSSVLVHHKFKTNLWISIQIPLNKQILQYCFPHFLFDWKLYICCHHLLLKWRRMSTGNSVVLFIATGSSFIHIAVCFKFTRNSCLKMVPLLIYLQIGATFVEVFLSIRER